MEGWKQLGCGGGVPFALKAARGHAGMPTESRSPPRVLYMAALVMDLRRVRVHNKITCRQIPLGRVR